MDTLNLEHREQTDEETFQMLKSQTNNSLLSAGEWKKLRLEELKRTGKVWSK